MPIPEFNTVRLGAPEALRRGIRIVGFPGPGVKGASMPSPASPAASRRTSRLSRRAFDVDRAAVVLDDAVADAQPQAGALARRLGGEERVEDPLPDGRGDASALVDHFDPHRRLGRIGPGLLRCPGVRRAGRRGDEAACAPSPRPPSGEASIALVSRFIITWFTLAG